MGLRAHMDPAGKTPSETYVAGISTFVPFMNLIVCVEPTKLRGVLKKHSSVRASFFEHKRY
jgi:hypothetical protein